MRRVFAVALLALASATLPAQQEQEPTMPTIHASTQIVLVDVTVQDKKGNPIHGLSKDSFVLSEDKHPQGVRHFEEHSAATAKPGPELPPMPAGTFTNYTPTPEGGALNILLLDSLNTPIQDQVFVRQQLLDFIKKAPAGQRIAIFGLSNRLYMLQGFSSDPQTLKDSLQKKLTARQSTMLDGAAGSSEAVDSLDDLTPASDISGSLAASSLQQFQTQMNAQMTQFRVQYTLDAFNTLAHYLQNFPGRKNLIWFSGSFPINIMPDATLDNPFSVMNLNEDEFRETTNLLARSQVAVYPVDARGLMVDPTFSAAQSGRSFSRNPQAFGNKIAQFNQSQADEHITMNQLADDTGGRAFYNTNDLTSAVSKAIDSGSNYYTLAYSPSNKKWDGSYRNIRVELAPALAGSGYQLSYRHGYYAFDPNAPTPKKRPEATPNTPVTTEDKLTSATQAAAYERTAMAHGAPTPQDILFKVRVLPASTSTSDKFAPNNAPDPIHPIKPPFRDFLVDYAIPGSAFSLTKSPQGRFQGGIAFSVFLYDRDGRLLNTSGETIHLNLTPENYEAFRKVVRGRFAISVPAKGGGEMFLRIGVEDVSAARFGVVEIPVASVAKLAPPPDAPKLPSGDPPATAPTAAKP
ncbi:VWA domain-containing protein [Granulicella cerasi]|uniref:VWA domain-containing protein n=1 Tax=Granulicella cerasi TaxID=741063 RepID=A0ABW1ZED1_9BACT|nr:VWA domain-containing protein [Granulicella cerasi]